MFDLPLVYIILLFLVPLICGALPYLVKIFGSSSLLRRFFALLPLFIAGYAIVSIASTTPNGISLGLDIGFKLKIFLSSTSWYLIGLVAFVGSMVQLYASDYIYKDGFKVYRVFNFWIGFFLTAMFFLIASDSILASFFFYEALGLASWCLIGYYNTQKAGSAALQAVLYNSISDVCFLAAIAFLYAHHYPASYTALHDGNVHLPIVVSLLLVIGLMAKSAQLPFSGWLPKAMEGPTPASALMHAATLVTAGIILLTKILPLLHSTSLYVLLFSGVITAIYGACKAYNANITKQILAYSTISHLGLMFATLGCVAPEATLKHLVTHAFFKAGIFLLTGTLIYISALDTNKDIDTTLAQNQTIGNDKLPVRVLKLVFLLSLMGAPFTGIFLTKEIIGEVMLHRSTLLGIFYFLYLALTAMYASRLYKLWFPINSIWLKQKPYNSKGKHNLTVMIVPISMLALCTGFYITYLMPVTFSWGRLNFYSANLTINSQASSWLAMSSVSCVILGAIVGYTRRFNYKISHVYYPTIQLASNVVLGFAQLAVIIECKIDGFLIAISRVIVAISWVMKGFDHYIIDGVIIVLKTSFKKSGGLYRYLTSGDVQQYILASLVIIFLLFYLIF